MEEFLVLVSLRDLNLSRPSKIDQPETMILRRPEDGRFEQGSFLDQDVPRENRLMKPSGGMHAVKERGAFVPILFG